jgi:hypothetical protein
MENLVIGRSHDVEETPNKEIPQTFKTIVKP